MMYTTVTGYRAQVIGWSGSVLVKKGRMTKRKLVAA